MDFAQNLSALMEHKGVSAYRMSVDLEISDSLIGYWRRGQKMPGAKNLAKLANYFGVTTDYLLGKEQKEKPDIQVDDELWCKIEADPAKRELALWISRLDGDDLQKVSKVLAAILEK